MGSGSLRYLHNDPHWPRFDWKFKRLDADQAEADSKGGRLPPINLKSKVKEGIMVLGDPREGGRGALGHKADPLRCGSGGGGDPEGKGDPNLVHYIDLNNH